MPRSVSSAAIQARPALNVSLAAWNIPGVEVVTADALHVYQLVRYPAVLMTRAALERMKARLGAHGAPADAARETA